MPGPVTGGGGLRVSKMDKLQDKVNWVSWVSFMYAVLMCMLVIVAAHIVVGAWSMVFLLRQHDTGYVYCV